MEEKRNENSIDKIAKRRARKYTAIFVGICAFTLSTSAIIEKNWAILLDFIILIPVFVIGYIVIKEFSRREEKVKYNKIIESEEFYQSKDGKVEVEPLSNTKFFIDLKKKAVFIAEQGDKEIIIYISYKKNNGKYSIPIVYEEIPHGYLLEYYKFVN